MYAAGPGAYGGDFTGIRSEPISTPDMFREGFQYFFVACVN
jgi:hypothetical protein